MAVAEICWQNFVSLFFSFSFYFLIVIKLFAIICYIGRCYFGFNEIHIFMFLCYNVIFLIFERWTQECICFLLLFTGIPSRKINNTVRSADSRNGLNSTEGEARGNGTQPVLSGTGEETVRLGKQRWLKLKKKNMYVFGSRWYWVITFKDFCLISFFIQIYHLYLGKVSFNT